MAFGCVKYEHAIHPVNAIEIANFWGKIDLQSYFPMSTPWVPLACKLAKNQNKRNAVAARSCQGDNSQLFGIMLSIYKPLRQDLKGRQQDER
jgi:hypothetical protein